MSTNATHFIPIIDACPTFDGSVGCLLAGVAEEIEARVADPKSLFELAKKLRDEHEVITDSILANLAPADAHVSDDPNAKPDRGGPGEQLPPPEYRYVASIKLVEGFQEAVEYVVSRGYPEEGAAAIVMREGVQTILSTKGAQEVRNAEHATAATDGLPSSEDLDASEAEKADVEKNQDNTGNPSAAVVDEAAGDSHIS